MDADRAGAQTEKDQQLRIFLLGGMRVFMGDDLLPPFPTQKSRSLFAYLLLTRQQTHTRGQLAGMFWGDSPENRARRSLNTTLWRLRRILPAEFILTEGDVVRLNPSIPYWLDVAAFEEGCAARGDSPAQRIHAWEQAIQLYRGDLLAGWYEDWILIEAERLRLIHWQALQELMGLYDQAGAPLEALRCGLRLLAADALHEEVHRRVMELYARLGQREAALAQFAACVRVLKEELAVDPAAETIELAERIRRGAVVGSTSALPPVPLTPPAAGRSPFDGFGRVALVGRRAELDWVIAQLDQARRSGGGMALLAGEAGVGKTRLLQEAAQQTEAKGVFVLWGRCLDMPAPPPYHGLATILRGALERLQQAEGPGSFGPWAAPLEAWLTERPSGAAEPALSPLPGQDVHLLWQAMAACLLRLGQIGVCLIVLEDVQWADGATLEALAYLASRLHAEPILLLASIRPEEIPENGVFSRLLAALTETGVLARLQLLRLGADETAQLVRQTLGLGEEEGALARFVHRETDGNPFFIGEVLKLLVEENYLRLRPDGRWETPWDWDERETMHLRPPRGIRQTLERRLTHLPPASRALLEVAAVLGSQFDLELLQQASDQDEEGALESSDDLFRRQLLVEDEGRLGFSHDKIRQVVYASLDPVQRRQIHRQAGNALAQLQPERVEEIAHHFSQSQANPETICWGLRAVERARRLYAHGSALTYAIWVIEAARQVGSAQGRRPMQTALEQRGQVRVQLGQYEEALADFAAAQELAMSADDRSGVARAIRLGGWVQGNYLGNWAVGLAKTRAAWQMAQQAGDTREAALSLCNLGACHNMRGEYDQARSVYRQALAGFQALGDEIGEATSLQFLAVTDHFLGQLDYSLETYRQALAGWERLGKRYEAAQTRTDIGYLLINKGELIGAERTFQQAIATLREIGVIPGLLWALIGSGAVQRYRGQCNQGLETLAEAAQLVRQAPSNPYHQALICDHLGALHWMCGHLAEAFDQMQQAVALAREANVPTLLVGMLNRLGHCLRLVGDVPAATLLHQEAYTLAQRAAFVTGAVCAESEWGLDDVHAGRRAAGLERLQAALIAGKPITDWKRFEPALNLAEGLLLSGQAQAALPLVRQVVQTATRLGLYELEVWGQFILGRVLLAVQAWEDATLALGCALDRMGPDRYPPTRAWALEAWAYCAAMRGRRAEAENLRQAARSALQQASGDINDEWAAGMGRLFSVAA